MKKVRRIVLLALAVLALFAQSAWAVRAGDFVLVRAENGGDPLGTDYAYEDGVLTITSDAALSVRNAQPGPTAHRIVVDAKAGAHVRLDGVNINTDHAALLITAATGEVVITLADESANTLLSGARCAGLQKDNDAPLTITGTGQLVAEGGANGAGIGGGQNADGLNIAITGGAVTAIGGKYGAGLGGGGNLDAAPGIGAGISIEGGTLTAQGGAGSAGIGDGGNPTGIPSAGSRIAISGGTVRAMGGPGVAGIGDGFGHGSAIIVITGGSIEGRLSEPPTNGFSAVFLTALTTTDPHSLRITVDGTPYPYGMTDITPDDGGMIYLYLPRGAVIG